VPTSSCGSLCRFRFGAPPGPRATASRSINRTVFHLKG
jgi:hypothetical protein